MAAAQKNRYGAVYGLAKGLGMDRESLHEYIYRETGRASLTELTDPELRRLVLSMGRMKGGQRAPRRKRTDAGGNPETAALRRELYPRCRGEGGLRKLYALCREMGRAEPEKVVNGLARRMFGVERQEWLTAAQCQKLAEALKAMARREAAHEA